MTRNVCLNSNLRNDTSIEALLGITSQPEESCPVNHAIHHKLSIFLDVMMDSAREIDHHKDNVFLTPPKKKEIRHLLSIIEQLSQWKDDWYEYYLRQCCEKKIKISKKIIKQYKKCETTICILDIDIHLNQSRRNIAHFNHLYQKTIDKIKSGYRTLISWEDRLSHCDIEDEHECESAIELAQACIEDAAYAFEKECEVLIKPIIFCVESLGPNLQRELEKSRKNAYHLRKMIRLSLSNG
jgi:hypothetical protein